MELTILISAFLTSGLTQLLKKRKAPSMSADAVASRNKKLRLFSAVIAVVTLGGSAWISGAPLDVAGFKESLEVLVALAVTFIGSQGTYLLAKRNK